MTTSVSTLGRRAAAAAGIAAVGLLGLSPVAAAEDANYGNIKESANGSLTIHKHIEGDGTVGTADNQGAQEGSTPVAGVQFTAYPIQELDLKKSTDWPAITQMAQPGAIPDSACANPAAPTLAGYTFGAGMTSPDTDQQGLATISNMPVKAYLVCETKAPGDIVQKAKPFVVTIPHPNATSGEWLYDVHAFPKNVRASISKTIDDQQTNGYGLGSYITFPVTTTLPTLDDAAYYKYFRIKDAMDGRLSEVGVTEVTLSNGTALVLNTDYQIKTEGQTVNLDFTSAGLDKLKDAKGAELKAIFRGKVTSVGDGNISNTAQLITDTGYGNKPPVPENPPADPENPPTTPPVNTKWGAVNIRKVDASDTREDGTGLQGAEFQVYNAAEPYADNCSTAVKTGNPLTVNGQDTFTSGPDGNLNIAGLFVSDSVATPGRDNKADAAHRCYVVVETKAPAGYTIPADADFEFTVTAGENTDTVTKIENTKHAVPNLPLTGASGKLLLTASGAALLMVAIGSVLVSRRRERKQSTL
ncbi:SpaH/EbpB family LPXTG-anchored major pilin [Actinomyces capricornis]|uniref:Peptidase n=1 Tax=Actinomyces capricornis TaxID=2755559 RepID=A0ABM7UC36_9ACTO|nr:SpaH/EbpB family LPXTG-anchored major pilin [Actinomyces capricornis]BDA64827.1 peptidase [Actinomyces capricornis]